MKTACALLVAVLLSLASAWCQGCPGSNLQELPAQSCGNNNASPLGWQQGVSVMVYIIGDFSEPQFNAIKNAYNNWNARLGAGLTFTFLLVPVPPNSPKLPASEWQFMDDNDCPGRDACTHDGWCPNGYEQLTITNVVPTYSGTGDQLFAHEVGHTFGIADCTASNCLSAVTIMNPNDADQPMSPMSPHCCDSKLMNQISGGSYGQSANNCSPILVQGTANLQANPSNIAASATFQQNPQSGDSIVVGCLGGEDALTFTVTDNQQVSGVQNSYNPPIVQTYIPYQCDWPYDFDSCAAASLFQANQVVSSQSQSQPFTVTCTIASGEDSYIDVFALEYADLGSPPNIDGPVGLNTNLLGVSPLACGSLSTSATNDLIASLYSYNIQFLPEPGTPLPQYSTDIAPTLGNVPACPGGEGGYCISSTYVQGEYNSPQAGGISVYPNNTPSVYTPSWTSSTSCPPNEPPCVLPMSCVSAAIQVIGP